jgi:hypothetical protein
MTAKEATIQQLLLSNSFTNKHVCMETTGNSNRGTLFSRQPVRTLSAEAEGTVGIHHQAMTGEDIAN